MAEMAVYRYDNVVLPNPLAFDLLCLRVGGGGGSLFFGERKYTHTARPNRAHSQFVVVVVSRAMQPAQPPARLPARLRALNV